MWSNNIPSNNLYTKYDLMVGTAHKKQILTWFLQAGGKDCKAELRDHDHVVECVAWAPEAATQVTHNNVFHFLALT